MMIHRRSSCSVFFSLQLSLSFCSMRLFFHPATPTSAIKQLLGLSVRNVLSHHLVIIVPSFRKCFTFLIVHQNYNGKLSRISKGTLMRSHLVVASKERNFCCSPCVEPSALWISSQHRKELWRAGMKNDAILSSLKVFMEKRVKHVTSHSLAGTKSPF